MSKIQIVYCLALFLLGYLLYAASAKASPMEQELIFIGTLNEARMARGLQPVELCMEISEECRIWSATMRERRIFGHDPNRRVRWENCARGTECGETVFRMWRNSPGHNALMMSPSIDTVGVAVEGNYWTMRGKRSEWAVEQPEKKKQRHPVTNRLFPRLSRLFR